MPTTEQILNKSATIYGQVGKSLQILNKRDKLKGADNAYVSVSNLDSISAFIDGDTRYEVFTLPYNSTYRQDALYMVNIGRLIIPNNISTLAANFARSAMIGRLIIDEGDTPIQLNSNSFSFINWGDGVVIDIQRLVYAISASVFANGTYGENSTVNIRVKPTAIIPSTFFNNTDAPITFNVSWSEDDPVNANAPWGAVNATINYDVTDFPE